MELTRLTADLAVIAKLADSPTETAAALKAKFDQAPRAIGSYLNGTLLPEIEEALETVDGRIPSVVDHLGSTDPHAALSAAQGRLLALNKQNKIGIGTQPPEGGAEGDIYLQLEGGAV